MLTNLFPRSERGHAMSQVVRQTRILLDCALVKSVGFTRVQSQVAHPFSVSHQRKRHARSITASDGFVAPRCKGRVGTIVFDPIRFAGPEGDPRRTSPSFGVFTPGNPGFFQVVEARPGHGYRTHRLFSIVFALTTPGYPKTSHLHQNLANRLK